MQLFLLLLEQKMIMDIKKLKENIFHIEAQKKGKEIWYKNYKIRIAKVEKDYNS
jgi:heme-degrading monooxygenase HmoA